MDLRELCKGLWEDYKEDITDYFYYILLWTVMIAIGCSLAEGGY